MQLREKTIRGVRATLLGTVGGALMQMGILVALARLLTPVDYGTFAAANIVLLPLQALILSTTERAVIIQGDLSDSALSSIESFMFWIMSGFAIAIAAGGGVAWLLFHSLIGATLAASAGALPVAALTMSSRARLRRDMAFGRLVAVDFVAQLLCIGLFSIVCAWMGFGPFSLVIGASSQTIVQAIGYRWGSLRTLRLRMNYAEARATLSPAVPVGRI